MLDIRNLNSKIAFWVSDSERGGNVHTKKLAT